MRAVAARGLIPHETLISSAQRWRCDPFLMVTRKGTRSFTPGPDPCCQSTFSLVANHDSWDFRKLGRSPPRLYFDQIHFPGSKEGGHMLAVDATSKRNIGSLILIGRRGAGAKHRAFNLLPVFLRGCEQSAFRPVSWTRRAPSCSPGVPPRLQRKSWHRSKAFSAIPHANLSPCSCSLSHRRCVLITALASRGLSEHLWLCRAANASERIPHRRRNAARLLPAGGLLSLA